MINIDRDELEERGGGGTLPDPDESTERSWELSG